MKTLIRGAAVVLPEGVQRTHVLFDGPRIIDVNASATASCDEVVAAEGLHLIPGVIDDQVHFRDPGATHKEDLHSASRACAKGGVTTFLEMPNTRPSTTTQARLEAKLSLAAKKSIVNYGFYIGATTDNIGELVDAHRTPGIKIFMGSSTGNLLVDDQDALERIFAEARLPITAHCEDESTIRRNAAKIGSPRSIDDHSRVRDVEAAVVATRRAMDLARRHDHRFHVLHVSTAAEADLFSDMHGLVTAEVCPHHLLFDTGDYDRLGTRIQMNPSVKSPADREALWAALLDGRIQVIATDHAPHTLAEKARPYPGSPSGVPAVENSLALMLDQVARGRCALEQVVGWMCDAPARVWSIAGKGRITGGYDADLVLVDLSMTRTVRDEEQLTRCRWSPWHGASLTGWPVRTWVMGREVFRDGRVDASARGAEARYDHEDGGYWA